MRTLPFVLTLVLAACGGNGDGLEATPEPFQHVPEISNLKLSPDSALYMEGDGSVQVTAEFAFTDLGRDIQTLHVEMSDGASLAVSISESVDAVSGTLTEAFDVTTAAADGCTVEIWLVDKAGQSSNHLSAAFSVIKHAPEISNVNLSPDSARYMEGDGSVVVSAEISFRDAGLDIQTLWVRMPDGTSIEFSESLATEAGTFTEDFAMSTNKIGTFFVETWLVDEAGDSSVHRTADFNVMGGVQSSDWTSRLSGLSYVLNDVIWDGAVFIAVGDGGAVLTSSDGIDWLTRDSGTDANLNAIAAYGSDIFAVGDEIVLLSSNHGANWVSKDTLNAVNLYAVVVNSSQVVVGGFSYGLAAALISLSEDRGDTWQAVDSWPAHAYFLTDLIYQDGLFVAVTDSSISSNGARVKVSNDGMSWNEIVVRNDTAGLYAVVHDGNQFIVAGGESTVFTSLDGLNWTERQTPVENVDYLSAAWNGSKLVLAGGISWWYWWGGIIPPFERPVGIASADGGENWETFNIDGYYQSRGIAWGNGRFVSVGQSTPVSGKGAVYTAD